MVTALFTAALSASRGMAQQLACRNTHELVSSGDRAAALANARPERSSRDAPSPQHQRACAHAFAAEGHAVCARSTVRTATILSMILSSGLGRRLARAIGAAVRTERRGAVERYREALAEHVGAGRRAREASAAPER